MIENGEPRIEGVRQADQGMREHRSSIDPVALSLLLDRCKSHRMARSIVGVSMRFIYLGILIWYVTWLDQNRSESFQSTSGMFWIIIVVLSAVWVLEEKALTLTIRKIEEALLQADIDYSSREIGMWPKVYTDITHDIEASNWPGAVWKTREYEAFLWLFISVLLFALS